MSPNELAKYYRLCVKRLTDPKLSKKHEQLISIISLIKERWLNMANIDDGTGGGDYTGRLEDGLMSIMGYRVGDTQGVKEEYRRLIIKDVLTGPIPLVGNPKYMKWWGNDGSAKRLHAMKSWLRDKIHSPQHRNHHRAVGEWKDDLEWVEKNGAKYIEH